MLTLLYVEPGKGGLQVEHDGDWIDAPPIDGALVVNIGELLEVATGGYLKATVHRVVSPEATVNVSRCRSSSTRTTQRRSRSSTYRPSSRARHRRHRGREQPDPRFLRGERLKSRLRAHPDVAARWWPDIVAAQSAT